MNFASPVVLMLLLNARIIFSESSLEIKASLALCKATRLSVRTLLVSEGVKVCISVQDGQNLIEKE